MTAATRNGTTCHERRPNAITPGVVVVAVLRSTWPGVAAASRAPLAAAALPSRRHHGAIGAAWKGRLLRVACARACVPVGRAALPTDCTCNRAAGGRRAGGSTESLKQSWLKILLLCLVLSY